MAGSEDDNPPPPPPPSQTPTQQTPHTVSTIKLPILKKGEYDIWAMKMEHYLAHTDYPIWEVIQRGNGPVSVSTDTNGLIKVLPPKTAEETLARERERKARTTLLMALPEDHLAKFHKMTDAKEMWEAIKSRFGGNDESKKMQKYILKQQFEGFSVIKIGRANIKNGLEMAGGHDFPMRMKKIFKKGQGILLEDNAIKKEFNDITQKRKLDETMLSWLATVQVQDIRRGDACCSTLQMTGIMHPSRPDKEIDESQFTYGPKQSKPSESDARSSDFNSCESNSSEETLTLSPEPLMLGGKGKLLLSPQQVVIGDPKDITVTKSPNTMVDQNYPQRTLQNKGIVDSGCSRHMTGNKVYLAEYQDFNGGPVAFGGSKGYITGKSKIKTVKLDFEDVCFVKELQHFNLFSVSQMCDKKNKCISDQALNKTPFELYTGTKDNMISGEFCYEIEDESPLDFYGTANMVFLYFNSQELKSKECRLKRQERDLMMQLKASGKEFARRTEDLLIKQEL
ncbi:hypothetical protein Tco_0319332 [Tanacetum coccineum]